LKLLVEKKAELLPDYYDPSSLLCSDEAHSNLLELTHISELETNSLLGTEMFYIFPSYV
jgi:hypothetical protein